MESNSSFHRRPLRPWMICILLIVAVIAAAGSIHEILAKDVTVTVDGRKASIATKEDTVEQLLKVYDIILGPADKVVPALDTTLKDGMDISVIRATLVRVNDNGHIKTIYTTASSVNDMLKEAGISVRQEDNIEPAADQSIYPGLYVNITRAVPVTILADAQVKKIYTTCTSVSQVLADVGIKLAQKDKVNPGLNTAIKSGTTIEIVRVNETYETVEKPIPYKTIIRDNHDMAKGVQKVVQPGQDGRIQRKILVVYENGKEVSRKVASETVVAQPKNKIVERGTVQSFVTSRGASIRYSKVLTMSASAYTAGYDGVNNTTSTGQSVRRGIAAVDPRIIPLGTRLYVDGYGFAVAADVGGAIKGNKIDLYMETLSQARAFGRRTVKVYILK
ncbi:ubiquitin-like domain-containing protein [Mahella australiensis]|uniref:3D domain-containing protein n=1 Tax=Mahella australiensis (strain DSM 15567 / CIP 107919 / 50-1 BON) TaxID=697281 RepID=F4A1R6_MAHA5|nr:ubiquitin-like domain-containing protein [Mahella australiensis]AEE97116.1 3D domain-containing protein [Mahella australiensis 50-1 BON]